MARKKHRCAVSRKLKKEANIILKRFEKEEYCSSEMQVILSLATEAVRIKCSVNRMIETMVEDAAVHVMSQDKEQKLNPMNNIEGVGG